MMEFLRGLCVIILFVGCASTPKSREPANIEQVPKTDVKAASVVRPEAPATQIELADAKKNVDAQRSLRWLQHGNVRYVKHRLRSDGQSSDDRKRTRLQQRPHAIILSCSDSRVPVEILFDQKIGEIYVIRTAAEQVDDAVVASIEYAVRRFSTNLILVLGHNHCDAIEDAIHFDEQLTTTSDNLDSLLMGLKRQLADSSAGQPVSSDLGREAKEHALAVAQSLAGRSPMLARKIQAGLLKVRAALYRSESGAVETF